MESLTYGQQNAVASSEDNTRQNMDKGHWKTETPTYRGIIL